MGTKPWVSGLVLVISMGLSPAVAAVRCRSVDSLEAAIAVGKVLLSCGGMVGSMQHPCGQEHVVCLW